ncbi:hypothetical protein SAMN06296056_102808 [Priestia filamentosa]|nr:hypothetical protein SAMN06296056_102808 [Priestia filamentosa]
MMQYEVSFPSCYKWMSSDAEQYEQYIKAFLAKYHPNLELVSITKHHAICIKK